MSSLECVECICSFLWIELELESVMLCESKVYNVLWIDVKNELIQNVWCNCKVNVPRHMCIDESAVYWKWWRIFEQFRMFVYVEAACVNVCVWVTHTVAAANINDGLGEWWIIYWAVWRHCGKGTVSILCWVYTVYIIVYVYYFSRKIYLIAAGMVYVGSRLSSPTQINGHANVYLFSKWVFSYAVPKT